MHTLLALALLFLQSQSGNPAPETPQAQHRPTRSDAGIAEQKEAISKLDKSVGTWRGSGWMMLGPSQRAEFDQTESIEKKLDGTLLLIEGNGRDKQDPSRVVHDALAVMSYDPAKKQYVFSTYANGRHLEVPAEVNDKGFVWGFDMPYGRVRFTLEFSADTWHEIGEISRDGGKTWMKNFEMTLKKEGSAK
jgi:hypothetical protein